MGQLVIKDNLETGKYEIVQYNEIKTLLQSEMEKISKVVVQDNPTSQQEAKEVIAKWNKLSKTLNDTRLNAQRDYMKPFNYGKGQFDELISVITNGIENIKSQLDVFESERKESKKKEIENIFNELGFDFITFDNVFDEKWLNKTYQYNKIKSEMEEKIAKIKNDISTLDKLAVSNESRWEILTEYRKTLDLGATINNIKERQKTKLKIKELFGEKEDNEDYFEMLVLVKAPKRRLNMLLNYCEENDILTEIKDLEQEEI